MSPQEVDEFRANPQFQDAVLLRLWDDEAKVAGLEVPGLEAYRDRIRGLIRYAGNSGALS